MALHNPLARDQVELLEIRLHEPFNDRLAGMRRILSRLPDIDTLLISIAFITARQSFALLRNLHFPQLTLLSAITLLHQAVVDFLQHNILVSCLVLSDLARAGAERDRTHD
ncbi:hypothetical protein DXG01_001386 [Tephrocybe rancida]|nr:hypothetical protein DXG01_001386 [Tephrocybe rancida]